MILVFDVYEAAEQISVTGHLKNRKLSKYFNRETAAAIVGVGKLLAGGKINPGTPLYYATGLLEFEDYGLNDIVINSADSQHRYAQKLFIEKGITNVSPLNQFKILQNMPLSFVSLEYGFQGDNAVIYSCAGGLLNYVLHAQTAGPMVIGAGKVYRDGRVEAGFAMIVKDDVADSPFLDSTGEAIAIFRDWAQRGRAL